MKRRKRDLHKLTSSSSMNSRIEEEEEEEASRERGSAVEYYANEIRLFFIHLYNKSSEAGEEEQPVKGIQFLRTTKVLEETVISRVLNKSQLLRQQMQ